MTGNGLNANAGTTFPILKPFFTPTSSATINLDLGKPSSHRFQISITSDDTVINFTNVIRGRAMTFTLDITINTETFNSIVYAPVLENPPSDLPTGDESRYLLVIEMIKTVTEEKYFVVGSSIIGSGGASVPDGTAENEHLEWNNTTASWEATDNLEFGATGPHADQGFLRFPNDFIWATARTGLDDGNMELKWTTQDELDFTLSNNANVTLLIRAQDAVDQDNLYLITNQGSTAGNVIHTFPHSMFFISGVTVALQIDESVVISHVDLNLTGNNIIGIGTMTWELSQSILFDTVNELQLQLPFGKILNIDAGLENILEIDETGVHIIDQNLTLGNNSITGVNQIAFNEPNQTITDDIGGLRFSLPDATDTFDFTIDSNVNLSIEKFFINFNNSRLQMVEEIVPSNAPTNNAYIFLSSATGSLSIIKDTGGVSSLEGADWATFPAVTDIDYATFDGKNIDRLLFDQGGSPIIFAETGITSNALNYLNFNVPTLAAYLFNVNGTTEMLIEATSLGLQNNSLIAVAEITFVNELQAITGLPIVGFQYRIPTLHTHDFFVNTASKLEITEDNIQLKEDVFLTGGQRIRSSNGTAIGLFVTDFAGSVGTMGSNQIPSIPSLTPTVGNLNIAFGSEIGCSGVLNTFSSFIHIALKVRSDAWLILACPDAGGNVVSDHIT